MIYADQRWIGEDGIGRFARNVLAGIDYRPVSIASHPASRVDPWRLARELGKLTRSDLFFSPGYNSPLFCASPFVFTIHDLNHIDRPENTSLAKRLYYATVLKHACYRAAQILTVSEFSRRRIIDWSGVPEEKVINVRSGVDPAFNPGVAPFELPFPYLLCVSNRKRHKNELRTMEAFARAGLGGAMRLVFTGNPTAELTDWIERNHVAESVYFVGLLPEAQMPSLYRSAEALIFASLYEGFGLPVLEAMACGTPVVTANSSALPEVAGDAALLVDPTSVDQIAEAMKRVARETSLRQMLREKGLAQAAHFPWKYTTSKTHTVLTECVTDRHGA
jgi:glycosyltransferase involved in cell wall biosynthesis